MDIENNKLIPNIDGYINSEFIGKYKDITKVNVLIIGPSGAGKSTYYFFKKIFASVSYVKTGTIE